MRDPYLIKGWPCEVWTYEKDYRALKYFAGYFECNKYPGFVINKKVLETCDEIEMLQITTFWENYRPIGTEWDFASEWAGVKV